MPTTSEIINTIAPISQYLAANDIAKAGLFGGGMDANLPRKIYMVRKNCEWLYDLDPTDTTLTPTTNYLLALCGKYYLAAANISGTGGTVASVGVNTAPLPYDFEVDGSSFIANGESSKTITLFIGYNLLFIRGGIPQSTIDTGGSYYSWDRDTGAFTCSPAAVTSEQFLLFPFL